MARASTVARGSGTYTLPIRQQEDGSLLIPWNGADRRIEVSPDLSSLTVARAKEPDKKVPAQKDDKK